MTLERMSYHAEYVEGVMIFAIRGELDVYTLPRAREAVLLIIQKGVMRLVFDLSGLEHLDSSAISFFIEVQKKMRAVLGFFALAGASPNVAEIFRVTRVERVLRIFPNVHEAVKVILATPPQQPGK